MQNRQQARRRQPAHPLGSALCIATLALAVSQAFAADGTTLDTVVVSGTQDASATAPTRGYTVKSSKTATKTDTPLTEIAQSVSVVTRQQIEDQGAQTVGEALGYSAGTFNGGRGAYGQFDNIVLRGFNDGMTTNQYLDGLRLVSDGSTLAQIQLDPYFMERVEVLKGPSSVAYGTTAPGGLVSSSSKQPLDSAYHEIEVTVGNHNKRAAAFDYADSLSDNLSYRVVGKAYASDTQQDYGHVEHYTLAPSLRWKIDGDNRLLLQAYLSHAPDSGTNGSLPYEGTVIARNGKTLSSSFYDGAANDGVMREQMFYGYQFEHDFNDNWQFRQHARYQEVAVDGTYAYQYGWSGNSNQLIRYATAEDANTKTLLLDNQLAGKFGTGPLRHTLLAGIDYQDMDSSDNIGSAALSNLDTDNPNYNVAYGTITKYHYQRSNQQLGSYLQDQLAWQDWRVTLGLRHDHAEVSPYSESNNGNNSWQGNKLSKQLGISYLLNQALVPYYSYSEGFKVSGAGNADQNGKILSPSTTKQHELGIKYQPDADTLLTAAVYQLDQSNVAYYDASVFYYKQVGDVRSRGLELEAKTKLNRNLSVLASYTRTDMEIVNGLSSATTGNTPVMAPENMATLWADYNFGNGLDLGGGVRYVSSMWADNENTAKLPSYTLLDLALRVDLARFNAGLKGTSLRLNVSNLLDKEYVASCYDLSGCYYGAGRSVSATVSYKW
ncbi:TonB-dependent siderophore receptor [Vogesella sp. GCM10023246]|uniref:TonB-dependent siderophore receptor n=1 Tax=Vogesella oryzagri TaxID=3160864 RepID=A0ABV1M1K6_9NEIS